MGAQHSVSSSHLPTNGRTVMDKAVVQHQQSRQCSDDSCSLPPSPTHRSPHRLSLSLVESSRPNTNRITKSRFHRSLSNFARDLRLNETGSLREIFLTTTGLNKSTSGGGIVTVNSDRYSTTALSLNELNRSHYAQTDCGKTELKKLNRISLFEPFLTEHNHKSVDDLRQSGSRSDLQQPNTIFKPKLFIPTIHMLPHNELLNITSNLQSYLHTLSKTVSQKQSDLLAIQSKIEQKAARLDKLFKARKKGVSSTSNYSSVVSKFIHESFHTNENSCTTQSDVIKLAGSQQIDFIVLKASEISGLLCQSNELQIALTNSLNELNNHLPEDKRLNPLVI